MKTPTTILISVAIVCAAAMFGWLKYSESQRYSIMNSGDGVAYRVDRKTGETWIIHGRVISAVKEPERPKQLVAVPSSVLQALISKSDDDFLIPDYFGGKLYNPTSWYIKEVTVAVFNDGKYWRQELVRTINLPPKSSDSFTVKTVGGTAAGARNWELVSALGYEQ